ESPESVLNGLIESHSMAVGPPARFVDDTVELVWEARPRHKQRSPAPSLPDQVDPALGIGADHRLLPGDGAFARLQIHPLDQAGGQGCCFGINRIGALQVPVRLVSGVFLDSPQRLCCPGKAPSNLYGGV